MEAFLTFRKKLFHNYLFGSSLAVLGVGGVFIFFTLTLSTTEIYHMGIILVSSFISMALVEYRAFSKDIKPILQVFEHDQIDLPSLKLAFGKLHLFPILTFRRIMGPHLFGLSVPAVFLSILFIHYNLLHIPYIYIFFAVIGAVLVAGMHAIIEFFLTIKAIQPLLREMAAISMKQYNKSLSQEGKLMMSIKRKFQLSFLYITVFPILLFGLATQVKLDILAESTQNYWSWAFFIILLGLVFAYFGAKLLFLDVLQPIVQLQESMKKIQQGHLTMTQDLYSDEFAGLVTGFNHMVQAIKDRDEQKQLMFESFLESLSAILDARDPYTAGHSTRVTAYSLAIGKRYGLTENNLSLLKKSAILHDIGKIGIPDAILLKDGKLTADEFAKIKKHPEIGADIIKQVQGFSEMGQVIEGVMYHHERYDGLGYPMGLAFDAIPLFGRLIAVADAFDAMTSDRPYRTGMSFDKALGIIEEGKGLQWDPEFSRLFIDVMREGVFEQKPESHAQFQDYIEHIS